MRFDKNQLLEIPIYHLAVFCKTNHIETLNEFFKDYLIVDFLNFDEGTLGEDVWRLYLKYSDMMFKEDAFIEALQDMDYEVNQIIGDWYAIH